GIAFLDVILDPLLVDGDVALEEVEALLGHEIGDAIGLHVHAVDLPVGRSDDALGEMVADEAVDAEDEDSSHERSSRRARSLEDGTGSRFNALGRTWSNGSER